MIRGIVFDLDGVITDTVEYHYKSWNKLVKKHFNQEISKEFNEKLKGVDRKESLRRILEYIRVDKELSEKELNSLTEEKNKYYKEFINTISSNDILCGIKELLILLKSKDIKIALASASKNAQYILNRLELEAYFDAIADPSNLESKPSPQIFLEAAKLINVCTSECLGIEDSSAGIEGINKAKMISVGVGDEDELNQARYIVKETKELLTIIPKLLG